MIVENDSWALRKGKNKTKSQINVVKYLMPEN